MFYPSADRNKSFILEVLQKHIPNNQPGKLLEISSGTGQHISYFAQHFPKINFHPTEFEASLLSSIKAYSEESTNIREPVQVDVTTDPNTWNVDKDYDFLLNVNMIHISPFNCTIGLFKNGCGVLKPGGLMFTYGPYANNGVLKPQSNVSFDRNLKSQNPEWGVRDIEDLKKIAGQFSMELKQIYDLPANNKCLVWKKNE